MGEWDDSSDEDRATDLELQPTQRRYDPPASHLTQDTSYTSYKPQAQTSQETRRSAEGGGGGDIFCAWASEGSAVDGIVCFEAEHSIVKNFFTSVRSRMD